MKKYELERLLIRSNDREKIAERADYLKAKYGEQGATQGNESTEIRQMKFSAPDLAPTREERLHNDEDFETRSHLVSEFAHYIPEFKSTAPPALLRALMKKKTRSRSDLLVLEGAVNSLLKVGTTSEKDEELVSSAIDLLMEADRPKVNAKTEKKQSME